jgi:tRNA pseudouridine13 synthase
MTSSPPSKKARLSPSPTTAADVIIAAVNTEGANVSQTEAEVAVGITEYVNPTLPSWSGVLKQRYTDFLVNEVDQEGNVVHLKSTKPPRVAAKPDEEGEEPKEKKDDRFNAAGREAQGPFEVNIPS